MPLNPDAVATSINLRLKDRPLSRDGRKDDRSVLALTTSSFASSVIFCAQVFGCLQGFLMILQVYAVTIFFKSDIVVNSWVNLHLI